MRMELLSLCSPPRAAPFSSSSSRRTFLEKSTAVSGRSHPFPKKPWVSTRDGNPRPIDFRPRTSGFTKAAASSNAKAVEVNKQETNSKDQDLAFVAGATGRVGSRLVRELLKLGFRVRAGVRSAQRAEPLVQSVRQMKLDVGTGTPGIEPTEKLEIIECDLEKESDIGPAIGNASVVLCCIGASEKEITDITGPYRIDYKATENLIKAATVAKVDHFVLLTSLGTNKIGFPAAILNLFWGVLIWKRKAEEALIASGLPYTIVRPGGMERPTDSFKETHNMVLADEDTYFGGLVSNLQVAELMACMAKNKVLSYCKVVEVIAETTTPLLPMEELLSKIPSKRDPPGSSNEKEVDLMQAKSAAELTTTASSSKLSEDIAKEEASQILAQKTRPLSPYTAYEDLKPPSSPSPIPTTKSTGINEIVTNVTPLESKTQNGPATEITVLPDVPESHEVPTNNSYRSPFPMYADLKPPSSPSPTSSTGSTATGKKESATENTILPGVSEPHEVPTSNSSYRSPFPMYEDLKPPTSPMPSSPKY
ncbi:protein TIC 62, chloroplastic isoform X1 [Canna indica]|uniref:Protein TIC 62, chloroplastic isoform X1 n=1 Tax=Canna indica TaxID=4628 RepID=A0AAQ3K6Y2_9LILI|nr:protein TIC 62, chloroplastic isoform X1 [Canna indica]